MINRFSKRFKILAKGNMLRLKKYSYKPVKFNREDIMLAQRFNSNIHRIVPFINRHLTAEEMFAEMATGYNMCNEIETGNRVLKRLRNVAKTLYQWLLKAGVDFSTNDFINHEWFSKLNKSYLQYSRLSLGWIVECYALPASRLEELHGIYGMGISRKFTKDELNSNYFSDYIYQHTKMSSEDEGVFIYENTSEIDCDIFRYFFRNDSKNKKYGLFHRLKSHNIIDLNCFPQEPENVLKLLAMFYDIEKRNNIILTAFWDKPSIENSDLIDQKVQTRNQEIIIKIKSELAKEISVYRAAIAADKINQIEDSWTNIINFLDFICWDTMAGHNLTKKQLMQVITLSSEFYREIEFEKSEAICSYNESLFCTMYLKLLQHEKIGEMADLKRVDEEILKIREKDVPDITMDFISGLDGTICKDEFKSYLLEHKEEIISAVINDEFLIDNDTKTEPSKVFKLACNTIEVFLNVLEETDLKLCQGNEIELQSAMIIFITLVELLIDRKKLPALFYHSTHTDKRTPSAEIKKGLSGLRVNKTRFARKCIHNLWKYHPALIDLDKLKLIVNMEYIILNFEEMVYSANSLSAMEALDSFYQNLLKCIMDGVFNLDNYIDTFNNVIWENYGAVYQSDSIYLGFFLSMIGIDTPSRKRIAIISKLNRSIQNGEKLCTVEIPLSKDGELKQFVLNYKFKFEISHESKLIDIIEAEVGSIELTSPLDYLK